MKSKRRFTRVREKDRVFSATLELQTQPSSSLPPARPGAEEEALRPRGARAQVSDARPSTEAPKRSPVMLPRL